MKQSVSLITLGVSDYEKANAFYAALDWQPVLEIEETAFFQANGVVLVLWARQKLAADSGIADEGARWGGIALAHNVASAEEVDAVIERAREAGGTITREPSKTFYGRVRRRLPRPRRARLGDRAQPGLRPHRRRQRHPRRRDALSPRHLEPKSGAARPAGSRATGSVRRMARGPGVDWLVRRHPPFHTPWSAATGARRVLRCVQVGVSRHTRFVDARPRCPSRRGVCPRPAN